MSSISQSILMALTVTVNKYASSNVQAVHRNKKRPPTTTATADFGRRVLFLSTVVAALQVSDSRTELLKKFLKKSEENKAKNDKERLDSYYKRNYKGTTLSRWTELLGKRTDNFQKQRREFVIGFKVTSEKPAPSLNSSLLEVNNSKCIIC